MHAQEQAANKRLYGQFFTTHNPFVNEPFVRWFRAIPNHDKLVLLEPFAGANNIVVMIEDLGYRNEWRCFDIAPVNDDENASGRRVETRDTLLNYPRHFQVAITNPPYLGKNSATARGLSYAGGEYDDLYKRAVDTMLKHTPYVAAILPRASLRRTSFTNGFTPS